MTRTVRAAGTFWLLRRETLKVKPRLISRGLYRAQTYQKPRPRHRKPTPPVLQHRLPAARKLVLLLLRQCVQAVRGVQPVLRPPRETKDM